MRTWLLLLLLVPGVGAQSLLGATVQISQDLDIDELEIITPGAADLNDLDTTSECRTAGTVTRQSAFKSFGFSEAETEAGCAEVRAAFLFPDGAAGFEVHFSGNRRIAPEPASNAANMLQVLRIYDSAGVQTSNVGYFATERGSQDFQDHVVRGAAGVGVAGYVGWYFADQGSLGSPLGAIPATRERFTAEVVDPRIVFDPIPLLQTQVSEPRGEVVGGDVFRGFDVRTVVPSGLLRGDVSLQLQFAGELQVLGARTPGGHTATSQIQTQVSGGQTLITLPADVLNARGPGAYTFTVATTAPTVTPYATLAYLAMVLPAVAAVLAIRSAAQVAAQKGVRRVELVVAHGIVLPVATLAYVGLLAWVIGTRRVDLLSVLPLPPSSWFVYIGLLVLLIVFLVQWWQSEGSRRRARELKRVHELERSNDELEKFAYVASHDLQEPLRKIISFTGLLEKRYSDKLDEKGASYVARTKESAARMRVLIQDLLEYAKAEEGERDEAVDLLGLAEDVLQDVDEALREAKGAIELGMLPHVVGRRAKLRQVLFNLIMNAIKYRDPRRPVRISVSARRAGPEWRVAVQDNGRGIAPQDQDRIFGLFKRLDRQNESAGTGIGLAVTQKIVADHGGRIWVDSREGKGSTFYFTLPVGGS